MLTDLGSFELRYQLFRGWFESVLGERCAAWNVLPRVLSDSMKYSLLAGGKRIRPVMFLATCDALGIDYRSEEDLAIAIECIHTYSLIHDDLPSMDNDDFRRGKPSNHREFGEGNAVLAGDGLLSYAFETVMKAAARDRNHLRAGEVLAKAAGVYGMVAGQSADLLFERRGDGTAEDLTFIHTNKTARMIAAPLAMAALLAERDPVPYEKFGLNLGALFQITDDILDGKGEASGAQDLQEGKLTAVSLFGMDRAQRLADRCAAECDEGAAALENADFLRCLVRLVRTRKE